MVKKNTTNKKRDNWFLRGWETSNFFWQLATVVIGILITFGGSALIQNRSDRKETAYILSMVRDELQENVGLIGMNREILVRDSVAVAALQPCISNPRCMPVDSLVIYMDIIMTSMRHNFMTTSLEVLKSSSQVQAIRNKELLRDLFFSYANLNDLQLRMQSYCSIKEQCVSEFMSNMDSDILDASREDRDAPYIMFAAMMRHRMLRNYVTRIAHINIELHVPAADIVATEIEGVIARLDKEIER